MRKKLNIKLYYILCINKDLADVCVAVHIKLKMLYNVIQATNNRELRNSELCRLRSQSATLSVPNISMVASVPNISMVAIVFFI